MDTVKPVGKITNSSGTTLSSGSYTNKPVKFTATDTGGVSYCQVKNPGSSTWSTYTAGTALSASHGWYTFRAVDKAGNISSEYKVYYDATIPTGTLYGGTTTKSSGGYTNATYVKYVASDSHSGVSACYVKKPGSSSYVAYTSGTQLTTEGTYYFYCKDNAGNTSSTVSITLDKTKPTGTLYGGTATKSTGSYTNASYVKYVASDSLSGVSACYVKMPGATSYTTYSSGTQLATQGTYYFYCLDKAGNQSTFVSITLDTTKPMGTLYGGSSAISSGSHTKASYVKYVPSDNIALANIFVKKPGATAYEAFNILTNEKYCGDAILQKTITLDPIEKVRVKNDGELVPMYYVQNSHEAIVSREIFNRVQEELARRKAKAPQSQKTAITASGKYSKYALTEVMMCGECGSRYRRVTWSKKGKKKIVWRCISRLDYGTKFCKDGLTVEEETLKKAIVRALNRFNAENKHTYVTLMKATIGEAIGLNGTNDEIDILQRRIEALNKKMLEIVNESVQNGSDVEDNEDVFKTIAEEIDGLTKRIEAVRQAQLDDHNRAERLALLQEKLDYHEQHRFEYDDSIVRQMVECIKVYHDGRIEVIFGGGYSVEENLEPDEE